MTASTGSATAAIAPDLCSMRHGSLEAPENGEELTRRIERTLRRLEAAVLVLFTLAGVQAGLLMAALAIGGGR